MIAGSILLGYDQLTEDVDEQFIKIELQKIAEALIEFKKNNGHYPDMGDQIFEQGGMIYRSHQYHSHNFAVLFNIKNLDYVKGIDPEEEEYVYTGLSFDRANPPADPTTPTERYVKGNYKYKRNWCGPYLGVTRDIKVDLDNDGNPDRRPLYEPLREYNNPGELYIKMIVLHEPLNLNNESFKNGSVKYAYKFDVESLTLSVSTASRTFYIELEDDMEVKTR